MAAVGIALAMIVAPGTSLAVWSFVGEHVCLKVVDGGFVVDGRYDFERGAADDDLVLRYPFPSDSTLGRPELLRASVTSATGRRDLPVAFGIDGWRWLLRSSWGRRVTVRVVYRQAMFARHAAYVLTSTREWGHPLRRAVLEVRVPVERAAEVSPSLRMVATRGGIRIRRAVFRDWMPDRDLLVRF